MKILFVSSEVVPFSKTGGLADVAGALPKALSKMGHDVRIITPKYRMTDEKEFGLVTILDEINCHFHHETLSGEILRGNLPDSSIPVYFVKYDPMFDRDGLYTEEGLDYQDNGQRFAFFCMASLWALRAMNWKPDVIHCNDWQTSLIPTYMAHHPDLRSDDFYKGIRVLYTIHNLAYQGNFDRDILNRIGLGWEVYTIDGLEFYGDINLMKAGIVFSDEITTVSEQYAKEIQTVEYGCGLDGVLRHRSEHLTGIMNGIDYNVWNPETDDLIPSNFSEKNMGGKTRCKKALQKKCGLPVDKDTPVIGMISRLADQKGFDLISDIIHELFEMNVQFVLLGTGDPKYHHIFKRIDEMYPNKSGINITFDNKLAHEIEAGADMFLMPSRFEPCGLNQLYSMKYGTVPIVRKTGGLADSVVDCTSQTLKKGTATGFVFEEYKSEDLLETIQRAVETYKKTKTWRKLRKICMKQDYSWEVSAKKYVDLYRKMIKE